MEYERNWEIGVSRDHSVLVLVLNPLLFIRSSLSKDVKDNSRNSNSEDKENDDHWEGNATPVKNVDS